jgi:serine/threonine protein kinase
MIASDGSPAVQRSGFLDSVKDSGVLTETQFLRAVASLPDDARTGPDAARALVESGLLTRYQADRLLAGQTEGFFLGQYLILDQIARGPTGRVYKALHRAMNRPVAIKVLPACRTRDPARRAELLAGARAAARLAHPNVLTVLDADQCGSRFYLVLEYVEGSGADVAVRSSGPLPLSRACEIVRQAALGLQHAHEKGVCHGTLTPGCLLVGRSTVKVANFGLDRAAGVSIADFPAASDPADYLSPELSDPSATPTVRSDLYSLGAVLYFLLTGRIPLPPAAEGEARRDHGSDPVPVESLRPDLPHALIGLVRQLLARDPAARPESAAEVAARLDPFGEASGSVLWTECYRPGSGPVPAPETREMLVLTPEPCGALTETAVQPTVVMGAPLLDLSPWAGLDSRPQRRPAPGSGRREKVFALTAAVVAALAAVAVMIVVM